MRFLARLNADPAAWLLVLMVGAVTGHRAEQHHHMMTAKRRIPA